MKKLALVLISIIVLVSCKSSKSTCEAYGHRIKITSTTKHIRK